MEAERWQALWDEAQADANPVAKDSAVSATSPRRWRSIFSWFSRSPRS